MQGTSNLVWAYEPQTENGAACLGTTGTSNVDLFGTRFILFDGSKPVSTPESSKVISMLRERLDAAYMEDPVLAIRNVLYLGNLREGGAKNHCAYMVALVYLWDKHPKTFLINVLPFVAENSCARDLLTLLSVITPNRTFPLERLWKGEQPDASRSAGRSFLKKQEMVIWRMLLKEFGGLESKDVVTSQARNKRVRFQRGSSRHSSDDSSTSLPDEASGESLPGLERDTMTVGGVAKRSHDDDFYKSKRNTWVNHEFKLRWHEERSKLHRRDYGSVSGFAGTEVDYQAFVDFIVGWFATRLDADDPFAGKWAPTPNGAHDTSTKGSRAFRLPDTWRLSSPCAGGISQAIAVKLYGGSIRDDLDVYEQKRFVMSSYRKKLSTLRSKWVPEHLTGQRETCMDVPDFNKCTGRWLSYTAPSIMKTPSQKAALDLFLEQAANGQKGCTVNSGGERPHLLFEQACAEVPHVWDGDSREFKELASVKIRARKTAILQWEDMQEKVTKALHGQGVEMLAVVDVSGSMAGTPMDVAVALGVLLSHANEPGSPTTSPYYRMVLSFDDICLPVKLDAGDSTDRWNRPAAVREQLLAIPWGGSTNLEAVFAQIAALERNRFYDITDCEDPLPVKKKLVVVVFSDMEFNEAFDDSSGGEKGMGLLKPAVLERLWNAAGLYAPLNPLPMIVFWNVQNHSQTPFPAGADTNGVVLLNGDSDGPFTALMSADFTNVTPRAFMCEALKKIPFEIDAGKVVD
jgi:hypothetical protein